MPYKDPADNKAWLRRRLDEGYGKALYQRRKQHLENERVLRAAVVEAVALLTDACREKSVAKRARLQAKALGVLALALDGAPEVVRTPMSILGDVKDGASIRTSTGRLTSRSPSASFLCAVGIHKWGAPIYASGGGREPGRTDRCIRTRRGRLYCRATRWVAGATHP